MKDKVYLPKLIIDEPPLQVLPSLAVAIGLNEAIFLQQLHWRIRKYGKERDGQTWVYNTFPQWQEEFPFWSESTLKRIVDKLREQDIIITTDQYNKMKMDRTLWYAIDYSELAKCQVDTTRVSSCYSREGQLDTSNNQRLSKENKNKDQEDPSSKMSSELQQVCKQLEETGVILSVYIKEQYLSLLTDYGLQSTMAGIQAAANHHKQHHLPYVTSCIRNIAAGNQRLTPSPSPVTDPYANVEAIDIFGDHHAN